MARATASYLGSTEILDYGFNHLNLTLISVNHYVFNVQSASVINKLGFNYEGILRQSTLRFDGEVLDNVIYSMTKEEYSKRIEG